MVMLGGGVSKVRGLKNHNIPDADDFVSVHVYDIPGVLQQCL